MEIKLSMRGELREAGTAPTTKGSTAKVTMVGKYILKIIAVNEERSSYSGEARTLALFELDEPALLFRKKVWFGSIHGQDGDRENVYEMSMRCGTSCTPVISVSIRRTCAARCSRGPGNSSA